MVEARAQMETRLWAVFTLAAGKPLTAAQESSAQLTHIDPHVRIVFVLAVFSLADRNCSFSASTSEHVERTLQQVLSLLRLLIFIFLRVCVCIYYLPEGTRLLKRREGRLTFCSVCLVGIPLSTGPHPS